MDHGWKNIMEEGIPWYSLFLRFSQQVFYDGPPPAGAERVVVDDGRFRTDEHFPAQTGGEHPPNDGYCTTYHYHSIKASLSRGWPRHY